LIFGNSNILYGATANGGGGQGIVFQVTTNGALAILASFADATGSGPQAALTLGNDGLFYGTTTGGGTNGGFGTVFKVTTNGLLTTLATFASANGADPQAALILGSDGSLYGTTVNGGTNGGYGTVFKVMTNGLLTSLVSFDNTNGANPYAGLTPDSDGNFYGTTVNGGTNGGYGTVFKVTTNGLLTSLTSFANSNGAYPYATLTTGSDGNFYGAAYSGGQNGLGTVFRVTTNGMLTSLASFSNSNGANPQSGWLLAGDGNLYGAAAAGGVGGDGVITKLVVPPTLGAAWFSNNVCQAALNGLARPSVQIQATTNLTTSWSVLTNLVFTNGLGQFLDPTANIPQKFYRALVP
jgi:uncharacterized repeat protein (TIGR03803 family)